MIDARRVVQTCLACAAVTAVALLFSSPALAQEQFPLLAATFSQGQPGASAQSTTLESSKQNQNKQGQTQDVQKKNDRMFYVMPNYLTVENEAQVKPLTWKGKFAITAKGAFDPYEFVVVGIVAGIRQADDAYPGFGQGAAGYAKRYGTAMADQVDGNIMVGAVFPTILKTDPRYFQMGTGRFFRRFGYALSRIFVARKDSGGQVFNVSEVAGNGVAIGISNLYYPAADRSVSSSLNSWGLQMGLDALGNELKEFWPDIHRRFAKRRHAGSAAPADTQ
ncbi:MAG: hypothetical protein ABR953_00650 [Candidatus Acidiferrales bacterium]|jgi:hypothetical protein